jgi:hypothetical protein
VREHLQALEQGIADCTFWEFQSLGVLRYWTHHRAQGDYIMMIVNIRSPRGGRNRRHFTHTTRFQHLLVGVLAVPGITYSHNSHYFMKYLGYWRALFPLFYEIFGLWKSPFPTILWNIWVIEEPFPHYFMKYLGYGRALFPLFYEIFGLWKSPFPTILWNIWVIEEPFPHYFMKYLGYGRALFPLFYEIFGSPSPLI